MDTIKEQIEQHNIDTILLDELIDNTNKSFELIKMNKSVKKLQDELKIIKSKINETLSNYTESETQKDFNDELFEWLDNKQTIKKTELIKLLEQIKIKRNELELLNKDTKNFEDDIMSGNWVKHLKEYSKKHNMKYGECMKSNDCKVAYRVKYGYNFTSPAKYIEEEPEVMEEEPEIMEEEIEQDDKGNVVDTYNKYNIYDSQIEQLKQLTLSQINAKLEEMKKETAEARKVLRNKNLYSDVRYLWRESVENNNELSNLLRYGIAKKLYKK